MFLTLEYRARLGVGLLRSTGWGGLVVLGPEPSLYAVAGGHRLLHSLAVTEQRAGFKAWTLLLIHLRLLAVPAGHLLVRSGVWCRCTPFASDPARGRCLSRLYGAGHRRLAATLFAVRGHRRLDSPGEQRAVVAQSLLAATTSC